MNRSADARKRVLIVTSWYPDAQSSVSGVFVEDQAFVLARHFDVLVYVPQFFSIRRFFSSAALPTTGITCQRNVPVWRTRTFIPPFFRRFARTFRAAAARSVGQLCDAIEEWGTPSVIHAHVAFPAGWIAVQAGKRLNIPVVLTEHSGPFSTLTAHAPQRQLVHEALSCAQRTIAVSPALAAQIKAEFPEVTVDVVGNVVRTDLFTPPEAGASASIATIAAVALLNPGKGLDILIKALALMMAKQQPLPVELVIAGDGPDRGRLEKWARDCGVHKQCRFMGMLEREAVVRLLKQCDVFVLPSLGETFSLALAEAMACNKPVIATRCGGPEFLITPQTGILVAPGNAEEIANALIAVLTGAWRVVSERSRQDIESRFGPAAFLRDITPLYESAISSAASSKSRKSCG